MSQRQPASALNMQLKPPGSFAWQIYETRTTFSKRAKMCASLTFVTAFNTFPHPGNSLPFLCLLSLPKPVESFLQGGTSLLLVLFKKGLRELSGNELPLSKLFSSFFSSHSDRSELN